MNFSAGHLRDRIVIQAPTDALDVNGAPVTTWHTVAETWGKVMSLSGREIVSAGGITAEVTGRAYIRWRDDVTARMRLLCNGITWSIVTEPLNKDGRRQYLELLLSAGRNDG